MKGIKSIINEQDIIDDWNKGLKQYELMKKYEIGNARIRKILKQPLNYRRVKYDRDEVIRLYKERVQIKEIKKLTGIKSGNVIYHILNQAGVRDRVWKGKEARKHFRKKVKHLPEPTCPTLIRLKEKYKDYQEEIGQSGLLIDLIPFVTVQPKSRYSRL